MRKEREGRRGRTRTESRGVKRRTGGEVRGLSESGSTPIMSHGSSLGLLDDLSTDPLPHLPKW